MKQSPRNTVMSPPSRSDVPLCKRDEEKLQVSNKCSYNVMFLAAQPTATAKVFFGGFNDRAYAFWFRDFDE